MAVYQSTDIINFIKTIISEFWGENCGKNLA